jgi:hypothetical protein
MNPHFFGDSHDLFKYDLIVSVMKEMSDELSSFTFVPMLTKNRPPEKKDIAGMDNRKLRECFNRILGDGAASRYFEALLQYFEL